MSKQPVLNSVFRDWTRGVSFTLAMGKTQVGALVSLHASAKLKNFVGFAHPLHGRFVQGARGLQDRGLVTHHWNELRKSGGRADAHTIDEIYRLTEAGELVVSLLKVSGVYQELVAEFDAADHAMRERRDVHAAIVCLQRTAHAMVG